MVSNSVLVFVPSESCSHAVFALARRVHASRVGTVLVLGLVTNASSTPTWGNCSLPYGKQLQGNRSALA